MSQTKITLSRAPEVTVQGKKIAEENIQMLRIENGDDILISNAIAPGDHSTHYINDYKWTPKIKIKLYGHIPDYAAVVLSNVRPADFNLRDILDIKPRGTGAPAYTDISFKLDDGTPSEKHDVKNDLKRLKYSGIITALEAVYGEENQVRIQSIDFTGRGTGMLIPTVFGLPNLLDDIGAIHYIRGLLDVINNPPSKENRARKLDWVFHPAHKVLDYFPGGYAANSESLIKELTLMTLAEEPVRRGLAADLRKRMDGIGKTGLDAVEFVFTRSKS
jgi:hypothetical protein